MIEIKAASLEVAINGPMDKVTFVAATLSLLATPGPTNTLLATSGAGVGPCRSAHLLAAELSGYLLAIVLLRSILGPVIATVPEFGIGLRIAVVIYLIYLAAMLWRHGARQVGNAAPVTFGRVFVTTLLNPKAIIFAFTILPSAIGPLELLPWLAALAAQIVTVGAGWILLGSSLRHGLGDRIGPVIGYRLSAVALAVLAGMIGIHSLGIT
ncbi:MULTISPECIES: LysE family translocator [unclassified Bradyrhizobium]